MRMLNTRFCLVYEWFSSNVTRIRVFYAETSTPPPAWISHGCFFLLTFMKYSLFSIGSRKDLTHCPANVTEVS